MEPSMITYSTNCAADDDGNDDSTEIPFILAKKFLSKCAHHDDRIRSVAQKLWFISQKRSLLENGMCCAVLIVGLKEKNDDYCWLYVSKGLRTFLNKKFRFHPI
jgi:hypothetical protein